MYSDCSDGELRLAGTVTATTGRLEICHNRAWGTICNYAWGTTETQLACRLLGFHAYGINYWNYHVLLSYCFASILLVHYHQIKISVYKRS
jgi:hypothetical protein